MAGGSEAVESTLIPLFSELQSCLKKENYNKAIELCNKIRVKAGHDVDALKIKCMCLIRQDKYEKALEVADNHDELKYEKAYCFYRLKKLSETLEVLRTFPEPKTNGALHLEAQTEYRLSNFDRCVDIYEELLSRASKEDDTYELKANLLAAYASAGQGLNGMQRDIEIDGSYEIAYNKACTSIQCGQLVEAEELLMESEKLCRDLLIAEGCSEEEIEKEVSIILAQRAYVLQQCGNVDKALSLYRTILKSAQTDSGVSAVAANNTIAMRGDKEVFDSFKRLKGISEETFTTKLSSVQQECVATNRAIVLYMMNKGGECRSAVLSLMSTYPQSDAGLLILTALLLKEKKFKECESMLKTAPKTETSQLALAHVYAVQGDFIQAANKLQEMKSMVNTPGFVATMAALYDASGDVSASLRVLEEAKSYYKSVDPSSDAAWKIQEGNAAYKLSKGKYAEAVEAYQELEDGSSTLSTAESSSVDTSMRLRALASHVIALSFIDTKAAEAHGASLPSLFLAVDEGKSGRLDAEALETQTSRTQWTRVTRQTLKMTVGGDMEEKKKERKRAARHPERIAKKRARKREEYLAGLRAKEDFNPSIGLMKPDPERWLPRKQRSYAKRNRRGGGGGGGGGRNKGVGLGGAQGAGLASAGARKDALKLDAAARAAAKKESAAAALPEEKKAMLATDKATAAERISKKKKRR